MKTHYKLAFVKNLIAVIDSELSSIDKEIKQHIDPYTFGLLDQYEQILGIGFTVCQTFLSAVHKGKNKLKILSLGPHHSSGAAFAEIINACANYWKHNEEWEKESISWREKKTIEVFENINVDVWSEYPLSEVFYMLFKDQNYGTFDELLEYLNQWANEVL